MLSDQTQDLIRQLQEPTPAADLQAAVESAIIVREADAKHVHDTWTRFLAGEPNHEETRAAFLASDSIYDRLKSARERREAFLEKRHALMQALVDSFVSDLGVVGEFQVKVLEAHDHIVRLHKRP